MSAYMFELGLDPSQRWIAQQRERIRGGNEKKNERGEYVTAAIRLEAIMTFVQSLIRKHIRWQTLSDSASGDGPSKSKIVL